MLRKDSLENSFNNKIEMINEHLTSSMFQIETNYFDIVDESRLFLKNLMPLKGVRFKEEGIKKILEYFAKRYNKDIKVKTFQLDIEKYNISGSEVEDILEKNDNLYKEFNFKKLKKNEFSCFFLNIVNNKKKLMHASSFIFGLDGKGDKYIIFVDPYFHLFADVIDTECFIMSMTKYFAKKVKDIKIYAQADKIQRDSNSCSANSIEIIRQFLTTKIAQEIIQQNSKDNLKTVTFEGRSVYFFKYKLPKEIKKFSQKLSTEYLGYSNVIKIDNSDINMFQENNKYHKELLLNEYKAKMAKQFGLSNTIYDELYYLKLKKINILPLLTGYQYVRLLQTLINIENKKNFIKTKIFDINTNREIEFNVNYWIDLLKNPESIAFSNKKIFKIKNFQQDLSLLKIKEGEKIVL